MIPFLELRTLPSFEGSPGHGVSHRTNPSSQEQQPPKHSKCHAMSSGQLGLIEIGTLLQESFAANSFAKEGHNGVGQRQSVARDALNRLRAVVKGQWRKAPIRPKQDEPHYRI